MRVLIVKTSSMGDLIHLLPALTDAARAIPDIQFDWVVESAFQEVPRWHERVDHIIPMSWRRWRKAPFSAESRQEWRAFKEQLHARHYDKVIDAQGLLKSALFAWQAKGERWGLNFRSAWEPLASLFYQQRVAVDADQHAVVRMRKLLAGCLGYAYSDSTPDYGILPTAFAPYPGEVPAKTVMFIHGTTWDSKTWPLTYWQQLRDLATGAGFAVLLPWGNAEEHERAKTIAGDDQRVTVLPKLPLSQIGALLQRVSGAVSVDTGLGHLCAALALPNVSLYGPTDPAMTGALGANQVHLAAKFSCAPCLKERCSFTDATTVTPACFATLSPEKVWQQLVNILK
ncbi:MAG: lipopolysaccharide heptosyltransferase I [Pseudomonadota bacterium]|nr:lipopolysaccharide heptosyltransferase I [Pseudomonadota bacterium]